MAMRQQLAKCPQPTTNLINKLTVLLVSSSLMFDIFKTVLNIHSLSRCILKTIWRTFVAEKTEKPIEASTTQKNNGKKIDSTNRLQ